VEDENEGNFLSYYTQPSRIEDPTAVGAPNLELDAQGKSRKMPCGHESTIQIVEKQGKAGGYV
jgi:hypothetical protein